MPIRRPWATIATAMVIDVGNGIGGTTLGRSEASTAGEVLGLLGLRPAWMRDGLCREHPEVSFYPDLGQSLEPARAVCQRCLVRDECLAYALQHDERHGVWGGLSGLRP